MSPSTSDVVLEAQFYGWPRNLRLGLKGPGLGLKGPGLGLKGPGLGVDSCITVKLAQD